MARTTTPRPSRPTARPKPKTGKRTAQGGARAASSKPAAKSGAASTAPAMTKDALRARVEKLERANATLRSKNRELTRASQEAQDRLATVEGTLRRLERRTAAATARAKPEKLPEQSKEQAKETAPARKPRRRSPRAEPVAERDPGDAVPPGVAVETPEPLNESDEQVKERLEDIGSEQG